MEGIRANSHFNWKAKSISLPSYGIIPNIMYNTEEIPKNLLVRALIKILFSPFGITESFMFLSLPVLANSE